VADLLDQIRTDLDMRLRELRPFVEEHERLETALRALGGVESDASGGVSAGSTGGGLARVRRRKARRTGPANRRERAPRGANRQAVLQAVSERPGATSAEIAAVSGVERNTLYGVLRRLLQEGEVCTRELPTGRTGYAPASPQPVEPTTTVEPAGQDTHDERGEDPAAGSIAVSEPHTS
jgi:hypothetical protein